MKIIKLAILFVFIIFLGCENNKTSVENFSNGKEFELYSKIEYSLVSDLFIEIDNEINRFIQREEGNVRFEFSDNILQKLKDDDNILECYVVFDSGAEAQCKTSNNIVLSGMEHIFNLSTINQKNQAFGIVTDVLINDRNVGDFFIVKANNYTDYNSNEMYRLILLKEMSPKYKVFTDAIINRISE